MTVLHQLPPIAEGPRHLHIASEIRRASRIGSRERDDLAAALVPECRDENGSSVIAPNHADSNHRMF